MYGIVFLMCVTLGHSVPCKQRDPGLANARRDFRYYFKTTTAKPTKSTDTPVSIKTITPRGKICAPYEFNETICEYVGDREICGYNKNPEVVAGKNKATYLSNGCWLQKGRVECGYKEPSSDNIRRPPIKYPKKFRDIDELITVRLELRGNKFVTRSTTTTTTTTTDVPTTIYKECVEIHSRIVCRTTRERVIV